MLKASALFAISGEEKQDTCKGLFALSNHNQNIVIETASVEDDIPESVLNLAYQLMMSDDIVKDMINELRILYINKKEDFRFTLTGRSEEEKEKIINLFQGMIGVVSTLHYCEDCDILCGKLIFSSKAQAFINGQYLEMALYKQTREILNILSAKYNKTFQLYRNVKVATKQGQLKNEFDIVIDFAGIIYVIESKSGKNFFRDYDKYSKIGREYGIVPNRFMLAANYISDEQAEIAEYFCEYYVTNLNNSSFEKKLRAMIENDL